jgi:diguanylate cyclase (GGDEF)-like protein/PAS domain S-box-containing protein
VRSIPERDRPAGVRRSWLERVLGVVRELGSGADLQHTLQGVADAVVEVLDFGAAAINVLEAPGMVRTAAVAGPAEAQTVLHGRLSLLTDWTQLLESCERWGELYFYDHHRASAVAERVPKWTARSGDPIGDGAWHPDDALLAPLTTGDGALLGILSVDQPASGRRPDAEQCTVLELFAEQAARSITEAMARSHAEARRREAEQRWKLAFEHSPVGAAIVNPDGTFAKVNDAFVAMLGYPPQQLLRLRFSDLTHPDDVGPNLQLFADLLDGRRTSYQMEKRYLHADGHLVWTMLHVGAIFDDEGALVSIVSQINDISHRKLAEQRLAHRAVHDPLTDLPNRFYLEERLAEFLVSGAPCGVLIFDIDRFKTVNDSLGHDAGDDLLRAVAVRLHRRSRLAGATVGRTGADHFVAIVPGVHDSDSLRRLAAEMVARVRRPLHIRGHRHIIGVSVGITVSGPGHQHADEVLREAEQALRRAKRQGRGRIELYDPLQDRPASVEDLDLENDLHAAVNLGHGLIPHFQPIVDLSTNQTVGYEALVRWRHATRGLLPPNKFLPLAEQSGLIVPLGWWMLKEGCRAASRPELTAGWSRWVAVNVSASQLGQRQLLPAIRRALEDNALPAERLHVEITETALVDAGPEAIKEVNRVADLGVCIALDDFGTGYSSLSLLRDLPVSTVKIDRSFVGPITQDATATAIVRSVIALCRELHITTVGEGVETQDQLAALRVLGCSQAQGYLLGRPAPLPSRPG